MHDQEQRQSHFSKPLLGISMALLLFAAPCPNDFSKTELVLKGTFNCKSRGIMISIGKEKERSFSDLEAAGRFLEDSGITQEGLKSLKEVILSACTDEWLSRTITRTRGVKPITFSRSGGGRRPQTTPGKSSVFSLKREGSEIKFSVSNVDIAPTADSLGGYLEKEGKTGCSQVTDDPPCFKCPDGSGWCISKPIK